MFRYFRSHIGWKIFFSYILVVSIGAIVLITASEFVTPRAFDRHLAAMSAAIAEMMNHEHSTVDLTQDLFNNFRAAMTESLTLAGIASLIVAIIVSIIVSRQVVAPIKAMMKASRYIANGHYDKRVFVKGNPEKGELDELEQLAVTFNQMAATIERSENKRRQLIGDVAHELRTPLTNIKGSLEGLIDGVIPPTTESFHKIYREADRLQRIVADLQELSRVEAGAFELDIQPLSVEVLISDIRVHFEQQYKEKAVNLTTKIADHIPKVLADRDRIAQVFINLVGNALQYTSPGGTVTIQVTALQDKVQFSIIDTGIGIAPEHLPMLFTRFYRVDKSRSRASGGSGIGLTIAKHLVEAHHGKIRAESEGTGKGSTFIFTIPAASEIDDKVLQKLST